jgi:glycosyltransferase involved in cell wall biosynthesis
MKTVRQAPLSVLIPTLNEEANIEECIRSVDWAGEVVVVDSGSSDRTCEIARELGARLVRFDYVRGGPKKKNWALRQVDFQYDWILILDADERITPALAAEIATALPASRAEVAGYYINRRFYFLGRWIRHAGYFPSWNLRLLRRGRGAYEDLPDPDSVAGDNEVHEHVIVQGQTRFLSEPMDHFAFPSIFTFVQKHNRYSSWEAGVGRSYLEMRDGRQSIAFHLRARRWLKRAARKLPFPHLARFVFHYFLTLGFLDGREGYILCRLLAEYEFLIAAKATEARLLNGPGGSARQAVRLRAHPRSS